MLWKVITDCFEIILKSNKITLKFIHYESKGSLYNRFNNIKDIFNHNENIYLITTLNFNIIISFIFQILKTDIYNFIYDSIKSFSGDQDITNSNQQTEM